MSHERLFLAADNKGVRTSDIMLTIDQARHLTDHEPDVAELLREYSAIELFYREAVAAMSTSSELSSAPALNSSDMKLSFEAASAITFDLSHQH